MSDSDSEKQLAGQTIEQLKKRFDKLNETRIRVQHERDTAQAQLEQLRQNAIEQFGTDDVEKLQAQLTEIKQQNEQQRAEYERNLDDIESRLEQIQADTEQDEAE